MRFSLKHFLTGFALIALAVPTWARTTHPEHMDLNLQQPIMVGSMQIPVGSYQVAAEEGKTDMMIMQYGKVVADVQGHWVKLPAKARDSEVNYDGNHLTEVQFEGAMEAFHVG